MFGFLYDDPGILLNAPPNIGGSSEYGAPPAENVAAPPRQHDVAAPPRLHNYAKTGSALVKGRTAAGNFTKARKKSGI